MARVIRHDSALADVEEASDTIAQRSPNAAATLVRRVFREAERLAGFPWSGRVVPEEGDLNLREIIVGSYRVIYRVRGDLVIIAAVRHGSRLLHGADRFGELD